MFNVVVSDNPKEGGGTSKETRKTKRATGGSVTKGTEKVLQ